MADWLDEVRAAAAAAVPTLSDEIAVHGLRARVEVLHDRWGVPHVSATTLDDLFRAQGFLVASERLFQLELLLRLANGRLAGMLGDLGLPSDRFARTVGWNRAGGTIADGWDEDSHRMVAAYREGALAWLEAMPAPPVEHAVLGLAPWLPEDEASWAAAIAWLSWNLSGNWDEELLRAEIADRLGPEAVHDLFPDLPEDATFPLAGRRSGPSALELLEQAPRRPPGRGSNAWAVAGSRSATGAPILANDPHLAVLTPSIWFECHLSAPGYDVSGACLPFAPGVVIGRTPHHAWGVTNVGGDTQDLYLERLNEDGTAARFEDGWEPLTVHREEIEVRGRSEPLVLEVRETRHGPILDSYVVGIRQPEVVEGGIAQTYALRWVGHTHAITPSVLLGMAAAPDFASFRSALREWGSPGQNVLYADVEGHIGYQCTGRYPVRRAGDGTVPVPGWTAEHEWDGWIDFDDLPWDLDPPEGFLATANNRIHDEDYPHLIGRDWTPPSRIRRIAELLGTEPHHTPETFAAMQADTVSIPARTLAPVLAGVAPADERQRAAVALLDGWDGDLAADSAAACVYEAWCHHLAELVLRPLLGDAVFTHLYGRGVSTGTWRALVLPGLLERPTARWFGADGVEARDDVLRRALDAALDELEERLGPERSAWRWGDLHRVVFAGQLAAFPGLGEVFTAGVVGKGGDDDTLDQGAFEPERRYDAVVIASCRQIHDLSDPDGSTATNTLGRSGHPASPAWNDQLPLWSTGRRHPMPLTRGATEEGAVGTTAFVPR
ncbi:MAG TPA: penicillin acylase family protein [Actinomycetota bacterium]|nr:penicillin acylase family protein [Actinomycetota bacterium]